MIKYRWTRVLILKYVHVYYRHLLTRNGQAGNLDDVSSLMLDKVSTFPGSLYPRQHFGLGQILKLIFCPLSTMRKREMMKIKIMRNNRVFTLPYAYCPYPRVR